LPANIFRDDLPDAGELYGVIPSLGEDYTKRRGFITPLGGNTRDRISQVEFCIGAKWLEKVKMLAKSDLTKKYINLLKKSLVGELYIENECRIIAAIYCLFNNNRLTFQDFYDVDRNRELLEFLQDLKVNGATLVMHRQNPDGSRADAHEMRNFTELSHAMIGAKRMDNIQYCIEKTLEENVPGDLIETGVWRGGATIFMRGVLAAYGVNDRVVWVADSFQGVPPPTHPQDANFDISARVFPFLAVHQETVVELFKRYGLLDDQVKFLAGWFKDTLSIAPIETLAVLRLDGDLYESTMDALDSLYAKVATGGFIIVDDYHSCPPCKRAIDAFRAARGISDEIFQIDEQGVFWRKR
jgi:O-methyltransferase